jgi:hypothetical protein
MTAMHSSDVEVDVCALERVVSVRPHAMGVRYVKDVVPNVGRRIFHAGPPYSSLERVPTPVLYSAAQAAVFEGWFARAEDAMAGLRSGAIELASAQDHRLMVPLSGVLTASMAVIEVADPDMSLSPIWVALNEGQSHATRLGRLDEGLVPHLRWLNANFAHWLSSCLAQPLALLPLMDNARRVGDDCHARTVMGSQLLAKTLLDRLSPAIDSPVRAFLDQSPAFALNFWMGACALSARAAEGVNGSSLVTRAGGNGVDFGIQLAGNAGVWVCVPAPVPQGLIDAAYSGCVAVGALGDSALVDFAGLGGQSVSWAPLVAQALEAGMPHDAESRPDRVLAGGRVDLTQGLHATSAASCVGAGAGPLVLIGMIDAQGRAGRIGGGLVDVPPALFQRAWIKQ